MKITPEQRTERLTRLRTLVAEWPEGRLHMNTYYEEAECGTAFCAAGLAAVDPWFRDNTEISDLFDIDYDDHHVVINAVATATSLADIFGLDKEDGKKLFAIGVWNPNPHAVSRDEVLANIDRLLAGQPAETYQALRRQAHA